MDVSLPLFGEVDPDKLTAGNETGDGGHFPVGRNRFWHGGIHLRGAKPVVAVRDGVLVAYRIDRKLETAKLDGVTREFSRSFVLLRHETATPLGQKIEFWSVAMHLLHWEGYRDDPGLEPPVFLRAKRPEKVKTDADGKGLLLTGDKPKDSVGVAPNGGKLVLTGKQPPEGHWARTNPDVAHVTWEKLEGWLRIDDATSAPESDCKRYLTTAKVKVLSIADPAKVEGEIPAGVMLELGVGPTADGWKLHPKRGKAREVRHGVLHGFVLQDGPLLAGERRVTSTRDDPGAGQRGLAVHAAASARSPVTAILPKGKLVPFVEPLTVRFSASTTYHEIVGGGFVPVDRTTLEEDLAIGEPEKWGAVVQPKKPIKVSRGDVLGWPGIYFRDAATGPLPSPVGPDNVMHFEIFSEAKDFLQNPHNEHWFNDGTYRLSPGAVLKQCEPLPASRNPKVAVDLPAGAEVRVSERFQGSTYVKIWRHEVTGWARTSELGHFREKGYWVHRAIDPFYTSRPTCWCDEAKLSNVTLGATSGDYLISRTTESVSESFKLVEFKKSPSSPGIKGWAREHELGDFYAKAHRLEKAAELALSEKPASWSQAEDAAPSARILIGANTWVRHDGDGQVGQTFRRVRSSSVEGWVAKERIGSTDLAKKTVKLAKTARLLIAVPANQQEAASAPAHAVLSVGAELTDVGVEQVASEAWVQIAFRSSAGVETVAWMRASELGPLVTNRYVLTAALARLFKPGDKDAAPKSLTAMENADSARWLDIGALPGEAFEWREKDETIKEVWERVEVEATGKAGWRRQSQIPKAAKALPNHYLLTRDLESVLLEAPAQVGLDGEVGDVVKVLGNADSGGVAYQRVERLGKSGWWPKGELGEDLGATRRLREAVPWVLRDLPSDRPRKTRVRALKDDSVMRLDPGGAFTRIRVVVTFEEDRHPGFLPASELLEPAPKDNRLFQAKFTLKHGKTELLAFDPDTTFVFERDAGTVSARHDFQVPSTATLRRDVNGHLWALVAAPGATGWVDLALDVRTRRFSHANLTAVSSYEWDGWRPIEESASTKAGREFFSQDGFCDVETLLKEIGESDKDAERIAVEDVEPRIHLALGNLAVRDRLRKTVCCHPSEWDHQEKKWERLKEVMDPEEFQTHMGFIQRIQFWGDAFRGVSPAPTSPLVWHPHPLSFLKQLRGMRGVALDQLQRIVPRAKRENIEPLIGYLNEAMERYGICTPLLQAHFLAQVAHESDAFAATEEYASGEAYERRSDHDAFRPGDGKRFKGRGLIQLTGRNNYSRYGAYLGLDLTANPAQVKTDLRLACDVAAWFWRRGGKTDLNAVAVKADEPTVREITNAINGGDNGLRERLEFFFNGKRVLVD